MSREFEPLAPACMKCEQVTGNSTCFPGPCVFFVERGTPGTKSHNVATLDRIRRGMNAPVSVSNLSKGTDPMENETGQARGAHTLGPWVVNPFRAQVDCGMLDGDGDLIPVCRMLWPTKLRSEDETDANARLIAAAPALLEALERLEPFLDAIVCFASDMDEHEPNRIAFNARAAIATATGEA